MSKITELNTFISNQIINLLELTKININQAIDFIQNQQNPYLNMTSVQLLNVLSKNTTESFNKILIVPELGYVENNYIVLTKYFEFDQIVQGVRKIPYSLLFVDKFMLIQNAGNKDILVPAQYEQGDNALDVLKNLEEIINSIDLNISLYNKLN